MATPACHGAPTAPGATRRLSFLDLPIETQREIISQCSQSELVCVALVSRHFRELAAALLYRNFHIVFPDEDDLAIDSPVDGLAGGLDTFTTSDYNYAKHLKDLSMDTLSVGIKGELSYQSYLYSASCGKFLNTLLHLTLKKARSLEAFTWNIRVELSRQVYRELHQMPSLRKVHVRMQAGDSYYVPPPPLPVNYDIHGGHGTPPHWGHSSPLPLPLPIAQSTVSLPLNDVALPLPGGPPPALVPPSKSLPKSKAARRSLPSAEPPTIAGFSGLKSLSVLDIDDLDIVSEIKSCVMNSSSSLTDLKLSLSDSLACQARRPPPDSDPEDSDAEDDFQLGPSSVNFGHNDANSPAKAFQAQEERKIQESLLGRIFGVELPIRLGGDNASTKTHSQEVVAGAESKPEGAEPTGRDMHEEFATSLRSVSDKLMTSVHGTDYRSEAHLEALEMIEKAARRYIESTYPRQGNNGSSSKAGEDSDAGAFNLDDVAESIKAEDLKGKGVDQSGTVPSETETEMPTGGPGNVTTEPDENGSRPGPSGQSSSVDNSSSNIATNGKSCGSTPPGSASQASPTGDEAHRDQSSLLREVRFLQSHMDTLKDQIILLRSKGSPFQMDEITSLENKVHAFESTIMDMNNQIEAMSKGKARRTSPHDSRSTASPARESHSQGMFDYLRETRGFSLESLSIYLIPVKASVLSRAIDLGSLKQLTLLNVGSQSPVWTLLSKENKVQPLALRSVYTDNVSDAFLACMSQLEELHELFMLERSLKSKPENLAPRSCNTIDQIRRTVLSKHMPKLKRLMIRNESSSSSWDLNVKAMIHICTRGKHLEELAASLNIEAVHAFMQYLSDIPNLRALHIIRFKNNDTCVWVMREIFRFIVDSLSHHPQCKLEWIAVEEDRVERVIRTNPADDKLQPGLSERHSKTKATAQATAAAMFGAHNLAYSSLPSVTLGSDSESDSDDDIGDASRLRFKTIGPMQFYDVWGVKIFEKEIRSGRL